MDGQEPHLRALLGFVGLDDAAYITADKLAFGPEAAEASIEAAARELDALAASGLKLAA
jgi:FMN-dependent NADH-azoreductase